MTKQTRAIQIAGKAIIAATSVPLFLYGIESARGLVRILGGIPSFISLVAIIVLGILELIWLVLVLDRKLPARRARTWATLLRYLGIEAIALLVIAGVPGALISAAAGVPFVSTLTRTETVLLPIAALAVPALFIIAGRLRASR